MLNVLLRVTLSRILIEPSNVIGMFLREKIKDYRVLIAHMTLSFGYLDIYATVSKQIINSPPMARSIVSLCVSSIRNSILKTRDKISRKERKREPHPIIT